MDNTFLGLGAVGWIAVIWVAGALLVFQTIEYFSIRWDNRPAKVWCKEELFSFGIVSILWPILVPILLYVLFFIWYAVKFSDYISGR